MKKILAGTLCLAIALCGCSHPSPSQSQWERGDRDEPLLIFAAASLQETLDEIGANYTQTDGRKVQYNFDSSGTLKTQIEAGAPCDVFISASPKQMNALEDAGLLRDGSRRDLLENKVVLAVAAGNPSGVTSFEELAIRLESGSILLAVGNADVPVGQYTEEIFAHFGLDMQTLAESGVLSFGSNVKEVTTQVQEGSVESGIIYATDAYSAGLETVAEATPELCGQVIYPGAVIAESTQTDAADAFLRYLTEPESRAIFEKVGFAPISGS